MQLEGAYTPPSEYDWGANFLVWKRFDEKRGSPWTGGLNPKVLRRINDRARHGAETAPHVAGFVAWQKTASAPTVSKKAEKDEGANTCQITDKDVDYDGRKPAFELNYGDKQGKERDSNRGEPIEPLRMLSPSSPSSPTHASHEDYT
jgi:hypothetical protein